MIEEGENDFTAIAQAAGFTDHRGLDRHKASQGWLWSTEQETYIKAGDSEGKFESMRELSRKYKRTYHGHRKMVQSAMWLSGQGRQASQGRLGAYCLIHLVALLAAEKWPTKGVFPDGVWNTSLPSRPQKKGVVGGGPIRWSRPPKTKSAGP